MKFLLLLSTSMKSLIMKYHGKIAPQEVGSDVVSKIRWGKLLIPAEIKVLSQILGTIRAYLIANNIQYQRAAVMKLVGDGTVWKGLMNAILDRGDDVYAYFHEPGSIGNVVDQLKNAGIDDTKALRVIMPLNMDENEELYAFFHHDLKIPVYPMICNMLTSKWFKDVLFSPNAPRAFFFPEGTNASEFFNKVADLSRIHGIQYFILKDEYDFDMRPIIPYMVVPVAKVDVACRLFYENIKGIHNYGGMILEEFIPTGDALDIVTLHMFKGILPSPLLVEKVRLKPYSEGGTFDSIVQSAQMALLVKASVNHDALNAAASKFYPYTLATFEYVVHKGAPKVIDVNGIAYSMTFEKPVPNLNPDVIYKEFISRVVALDNNMELQRQMLYQEMAKGLYDRFRQFGPAFYDGDKVTSLIDGEARPASSFL